MRVVISPAAEADLTDIYDYSTVMWGETHAAVYLDTLVTRLKWLAVNRPLWQARDDVRPGLCVRTEGTHLIIFRDGVDPLQIVRVLHQRTDPVRHLQP